MMEPERSQQTMDQLSNGNNNEDAAFISESEQISQWKKGIQGDESYQVQGLAEHGGGETIHTIRKAEEVAFSNWINTKLRNDKDLLKHLPVEQDNGDLYVKVQDGLIICKLINVAKPDTIAEREINKKNLNTYSKLENLGLAIRSCKAIGCNLINIDAADITRGTPHLVLALLWQIIRLGLFRQINLEHTPGMFRLLKPEESLEELHKITPEHLLMRWANYHLAKANLPLEMNNFTSDICDSTVYTHLIYQVAPPEAGVTLEPLKQEGNLKRATYMLREAAKIDCDSFVTPEDVVEGNFKLNVAFTAHLFNKLPALPEPPVEEHIERVHVEPLSFVNAAQEDLELDVTQESEQLTNRDEVQLDANQDELQLDADGTQDGEESDSTQESGDSYNVEEVYKEIFGFNISHKNIETSLNVTEDVHFFSSFADHHSQMDSIRVEAGRDFAPVKSNDLSSISIDALGTPERQISDVEFRQDYPYLAWLGKIKETPLVALLLLIGLLVFLCAIWEANSYLSYSALPLVGGACNNSSNANSSYCNNTNSNV